MPIAVLQRVELSGNVLNWVDSFWASGFKISHKGMNDAKHHVFLFILVSLHVCECLMWFIQWPAECIPHSVQASFQYPCSMQQCPWNLPNWMHRKAHIILNIAHYCIFRSAFRQIYALTLYVTHTKNWHYIYRPSINLLLSPLKLLALCAWYINMNVYTIYMLICM